MIMNKIEFEDKLIALIKDAYEIQKKTEPGEQAAFDRLAMEIAKDWRAGGIDPYQQSYKIFATLVMIRDYITFIEDAIPPGQAEVIYWFMGYMAFVWWPFIPDMLNENKFLLDRLDEEE